jgi:hypothetical protein
MHHEVNELSLVPTIVSRRSRRHVVHCVGTGTPARGPAVGRRWWFRLVDAQAAEVRRRRKRR